MSFERWIRLNAMNPIIRWTLPILIAVGLCGCDIGSNSGDDSGGSPLTESQQTVSVSAVVKSASVPSSSALISQAKQGESIMKIANGAFTDIDRVLVSVRNGSEDLITEQPLVKNNPY